MCDAIELDSGDYSFAYVTRWAEGSTDLLKETGERVIACAKQILAGLEVPDAARDSKKERSKAADSNAVSNEIVSARITSLPKRVQKHQSASRGMVF